MLLDSLTIPLREAEIPDSFLESTTPYYDLVIHVLR